MKKITALFIAATLAAGTNAQAASFWDWLKNQISSPARGTVGKCVCDADPENPCGFCGKIETHDE